MAAWYVPALGPAPKWCSYIDTLTDEMDGADTGAGTKGVYEDFKFVDRAELERLGMSHLIGTQLLRPYMHGYFINLALYERARLLSNPTAYADARERAIKAKLEKQAESRIRAVKNPSSMPECGSIGSWRRRLRSRPRWVPRKLPNALQPPPPRAKRRPRRAPPTTSSPIHDSASSSKIPHIRSIRPRESLPCSTLPPRFTRAMDHASSPLSKTKTPRAMSSRSMPIRNPMGREQSRIRPKREIWDSTIRVRAMLPVNGRGISTKSDLRDAVDDSLMTIPVRVQEVARRVSKIVSSPPPPRIDPRSRLYAQQHPRLWRKQLHLDPNLVEQSKPRLARKTFGSIAKVKGPRNLRLRPVQRRWRRPRERRRQPH